MKFTIPLPPPCGRLFANRSTAFGLSAEGHDYVGQLRRLLAQAGVVRFDGPVRLRLEIYADLPGWRMGDVGHALVRLFGVRQPAWHGLQLFDDRHVVRLDVRKGGPRSAFQSVVVEILDAE